MDVSVCDIILDENDRELNIKGTVEFPLSIYNDYLAVQAVPCHWHEEIELIIVESGVLKISVEFENFTLTRGDGIFINEGRFHSCESSKNTNCILKSIVFHPRIIYGDTNSIYYKKYMSGLIEENNLDFCLFRNDVPAEKKVLQEILHTYNLSELAANGYEFSVREHVTKIIMYIIDNTNSASKETSNKRLRDLKRCRKMLRYIENHFSEDISLFDIASSAMIGESECLRCFKHILGTSPIQYVKKYRLQKAQSMLLTTTKSIIDIGFACGFSEISYFSKAFKEMYACTPSGYRKCYVGDVG